MRHKGLTAAILLFLASLAGAGHQVRLQAGALTLVDPGRVSAGVLVNLTGTGFATTATANDVTFTPAGGNAVTVRASAIATVNAAQGIRRLSVAVPALPLGQASIRVRNTTTGEESTAASVSIVSITPSVTTLQQGESREIVVTGSPAAGFTSGARVALGAGITVGAVTVASPTSLVVQVSVAQNAALGVRSLDVTSPGVLARDRSISVVAPSATNAAPTVNAGSDQAVTLPAAATLNGTANDDGLPAGSTLALQWSQVSGPGTTTFGAPTSASTSATFSAAGTYVLRLTASDGELSANSTVTVTVTAAPPENAAPTVDAGADQAVTLPAAATLNGSANDDGLPAGSTLALQWSQVSGPGTTTFGAPTSASTSATFSTVGTYVLRLTASDGLLSASDTVTVTVAEQGGGGVDPTPANRAPAVDAGVDRVVTLPAGVTLDAQVTDDGYPAPSALQITWEQLSGPALATFATPTQASTGVFFPNAGVYVLRVNASDGDLSSSDEVRVTVNPAPQPANAAPVVTAGAAATIVLPSPMALSATVTDDGRPAPARIVVTWSQVSGPGVAVIADRGSAMTSATTTVAGTYVFRVTADDGALAGSAEMTVVVQPEPPPVNAPPTISVAGDARVTLPSAAMLRATVADDGRPTAAPPAVSWSKVTGPGVAVFASPAAASSAVTFSQAGTYVLRATASDGLLSASADVTVIVDAAPPTNTMPRVDAGPDVRAVMGTPLPLVGQVQDDGLPSGSSLSTQWSMAIGPSTVSFAAAGSLATTATFGMPGRYVIELVASDGELVGSDTLVVNVVPAEGDDLLAPVITLDGPTRALPGTEVRVTARVSDDVGVTRVTFVVDGEPRDPQTTAPFATLVRLPDVAAPGQIVRVRATAEDAVGHVSADELAIAIASTPDVTPPELDLRTPEATRPGDTVTALALASDESGIAQVEFFVDEVSVGVDTDAPYEWAYAVPVSRPAGPLAVRADAVDNAGNRASVTRVVQVTADADTTAPTVSVFAPATAFGGATVQVEAVVTDPGGVAGVTFSVAGLTIDDLRKAPWSVPVSVPDLPVGTTLQVTAVARDFSGNTGSASATITIVDRPITGVGLVTGRVFDDRSGLPLAGARVAITSGVPGGPVSFRRDIISDAAGRYQVDTPAGAVRVVVQLDGYVQTTRMVDVAAGAIASVFDARLTPRGTAVPVTSAAGGALTSGAHRLDVAAGAVVGSAALTLAHVSGQGLTAHLPAGWTPVAAAHVGPDAQAFVLPVSLSMPLDVAVPAGRTPALVQWDAVAEQWRVVADAVAVASGRIEHGVTRGGQYVVVLADALPLVPPAAVTGAWLAGVPRPEPSDSVTSAVTPDPRVLFASPDARSMVTGTVTSVAPVTSGLFLHAALDETYAFVDGERWRPVGRLQDVVLYQRPAAPLTSEATVPVGPSRAFDPLSLQRGVISVELRIPIALTGGSIVGSGGGTVQGDDEVELAIPAGAVDAATQMAVRRVPVESLGLTLPIGVTALDAIDVLVTSLTQPASLSLPVPAGLTDATRVVVARLTEINGRSVYQLAGLAAVVGGRVQVVLEAGGQPTGLPGIRAAGTYVLLQAPSPLGFAAGRVVDPVGAAVVGAVVTPSTLPVVSVSTAAGAYFVAAPNGAVVVAAADEQRGDRGERPAFLPSQTVTPLTLTIVPVPPQITAVRPAGDARGVLVDDPVTVTFSEPIAASSVTGAVRLVGPGDVDVPFTTALTRGGTVLEVRSVAAFETASRYVLTVSTAITDLAGHALQSALTSAFRTVDLSGPEVPPPGTVTASVPDAGGRVTVTGAPGTAVPGTRVFVENMTRGTSALALTTADGSFATGLVASVTDVLRVRIVDEDEHATIVAIETMRQQNPDGSVSQAVSAAGGVVEGPEGTRASIKPGTFPAGTVVTMKAVPVADFPRQLSEAERVNFSLEKAISLDFDGATPAHYVDVSWPAGPEDKPTDQWVLTESIFVNGEWAMNVTDTVKYRDGRLTTASPPCPGVTAAAVYGLLKSTVPYGLNYAQMYADGRYKLKMSMEVFQSAPIAIPYSAFSVELPKVVCFPAFVGRMSITPNTTRVTVPGDALRPADTALEVELKGRSAPLRFERRVAPFHLRVHGFRNDAFTVYAIGPEDPTGTKVHATRYDNERSFIDVNEADKQTMDFRFESSGVASPVTLVVDPDIISKPVTAFKVVAVRANASLVALVDDQKMTVNVPGAVADVVAVKAVTPHDYLGLVDFDLRRDVPFMTFQAVGPGNLVLRASPGTIDPPREEMGGVSGPARTRLYLASDEDGFGGIDIPSQAIVQGGLEFPFDGPEGATYRVVTEYDTRPPYAVELPTVKYVLRNVNTGQILKTIFGQAPPRDEPVELPPLTDDDVSPTLLSAPSRMDTFDPAGLLTFTFSESMNVESVRKAIAVMSGDEKVAGQVRISDQNRVATFVPDVPLDLDRRYTVTVSGALDLAGNTLAEPATFLVNTFQPRSLSLPDAEETPTGLFKDTAWLFRDDGTQRKRHLFAVLGGSRDNVRWLDGTDPARPVSRGLNTGTESLQRIAAIDTDRLPALGAGRQMLLATTYFNVNRSGVQFFRASEPGSLDYMGGMTLSNSLVDVAGYARGVVLHEVSYGVVAMVAVENHGVMALGVTDAIAGSGRVRTTYPMLRVKDIARYRDGVVAVGWDSDNKGKLVVLGESLNELAVGPTPAFESLRPTVVTVGEGVHIDLNRDGEQQADERMDIAVVGTQQSIVVVRISKANGEPDAYRFMDVSVDGVVKQIEIDQERSRAIALVDSGSGTFLKIVDLARGEIDPPDGQADPRIIYSRSYPQGANGLRLDRDTGLLYISTPSTLDTWLVADRCCDLGVELTADLDKKARGVVSGSLGDVLAKELSAIKRGVVLGLARAEQTCPGFDVSKLRLIESGSSACLWAADPVRACGSNYQPLVSDHDISTFMPDEWYQTQVPDPNWDGEGERASVLLAGCVVAGLSDPFIDPITEQPRAVGDTGVVFKDISFIPNFSRDLENMEYRLERTIQGLPGDADNDLAMGRQLLAMKHLTEAYGVDLRGTEGYKPAYAAVMVDEAEFEARFRRFREVTRISEAEGYEWGVLMEFMLAKAKVYLRFRGASDERSTFHDLWVKQYHTAAKAGIRAAAARIVAHAPSRDIFLRLRREEGNEADGLKVFRKDACLIYQRSVRPSEWPSKPCGSMEEYVAATAVRAMATGLFTEAEVLQINEFYRVKADEQPIVTEREADKFIADVDLFVGLTKVRTWPVYQTAVAGDPRASEREANRVYAEGNGPGGRAASGGRIVEVLRNTKVTVAPKVYNRGFMSAPDVYLRAYVAPPGGDGALGCVGEDSEGDDPDPMLRDRCRMALNLPGGSLMFPAYRHATTGKYMPVPTSRSIDAFPIKVDQRAWGQRGYIAFTLDLPERSANEADRTNNVAGAFYYILNAFGVPPDLPANVPTHVNPSLLAPDPYCLAAPQLTVTQSVVLDGQEHTSPVSAYLGASYTLRVAVTNTGGTPVDNVLAGTSLKGNYVSVGGIAPGATKVRDVPMLMPSEPANLESVATAMAPEMGISTASILRIGARCEPMIAELEPNPNPLVSRVKMGGRAVRHYMALHPTTLAPLPNVAVTFVGDGGTSLDGYTFVSDEKGLFTTVVASSKNPIAGIAIPARNETRLETWTLASVNGRAPVCNAEKTFSVQSLGTFPYQPSIEAGAAISVGLKVFGKGLSADFGGAYRVELPSTPLNLDPAGAGRTTIEPPVENIQGVTWERKAEVGISGDLGWEGVSASSEFNGAQWQAKGLSLKASGKASATQAYRYHFAANPANFGTMGLDWPFLVLLFPNMSEADASQLNSLFNFGTDQYMKKALEQEMGQLFDPEKAYREYRNARVAGLALSAEAVAEGFNGTIDFVDKSSGPKGEENKTSPFFSEQAGGTASASVAYEKFEHLIPGRVVDEDVPTDLVHTIDIQGKYDWKSSYTTSLEKAKGEIDGSGAPDVAKEKVVDYLKWVESRLSNSETGAFDGGIRFRVFARPREGRYRLYRLEVGFKTTKTFGYIADPDTPSADTDDQYRLNFVVEDKDGKDGTAADDQVEQALWRVIGKTGAFVQLLSDAEKKRTNDFLNGLGWNVNLLAEQPSVFSAQDLYDNLIAFVRALFDVSEVATPATKTYFYEEVRRGKGETTDLGVGARAAKIGFSVSPLNLEYVTTHDSARGVIVGGKGYLLEDYSGIRVNPPDGGAILSTIIASRLDQVYQGLGELLRKGWEETPEGQRKSTMAEVRASNSIDARLMRVFSIGVEPVPAPSRPAPYRSNADAYPAGKPHYGVGDVYVVQPTAPLSGPVTLSFTYDDAEVAGIDESTLRLYQLTGAQEWTPVPATIDLAANRVTASVTPPGAYTLAPRMPAGAITWRVLAWNSGSTSTTITLEGTGVKTNDGSALAPGTLIHVQLTDVDETTATFGTADASPQPGHQVLADANGRFQVVVTVPGTDKWLGVRGFSDIGTALGTAKVVRP
ncbi:MAG: Ig-like domain-containing protein [Acidobacteria bacterium]|nr:Ig-like domain-containing protein [Acidobacteriota bacterium]